MRGDTEMPTGDAYVIQDFRERPLLVFWETTRACGLVCRHCRADAIQEREEDELDTDEARRLLESVGAFGSPIPTLILTGGDVLLRPDLPELIARGTEMGIRMGLAPSVTPLLSRPRLEELVEQGIRAISLSLDGATASVHDGIRGVQGTYDATLRRLRDCVDLGMRVQVNSAVMRSNVHEMADLFGLIREMGIRIWEVFFLIHTGRGAEMEDIEPWEYEEVCHFLYEASQYGVLVRTTEAPFFRRIVLQRAQATGEPPVTPGTLLRKLRTRLAEIPGEPSGESSTRGIVTGDGRGIVFINHRGDVYPSGYLDLSAGNVRREGLVSVYRNAPLFRSLRMPGRLKGRCGTCTYRELCGGSRARAYAIFGDPLEEDPACVYLRES
jgi:radical SAM protein